MPSAFSLVAMALLLQAVLFILAATYGIQAEISKKIIIDTDTGADDGVAIALALGAELKFGNFTLIGLTAVSGNTDVDNVGRNILKILKTANRLDIPVYKGLNDSILFTPANDNFFGEDGFGDFPFPDPPSEDIIQKTHAVNYLTSIIRENPGEITLICIGPLSNIAMAIRMDPTFFNNLADIIILGGSVRGFGNVKPGVEFNIYIDPEAKSIVLQAATLRVQKGGSAVKLVSWETAYASKFDWNWRINELGSQKTNIMNLLNNAERISSEHSDDWYYSDSIAVVLGTVPEIINTKNSSIQFVAAETCGKFGRGALFVDYSNALNESNTKQVLIVDEINIEEMKKLLLYALNY